MRCVTGIFGICEDVMKAHWILPDGSTITAEVREGQNLMEAAVAANVPRVIGECGGSLSCATCHVYVAPDWAAKTSDVGEFEDAMLDVAEALETSITVPRQLGVGLWRYDFAAEEFVVHRLSVSGANMLIDFGLPGASILLCLSGELAVSNSLEERLVLRKGEAAFLSDDARYYSITGSGDGLLASATA